MQYWIAVSLSIGGTSLGVLREALFVKYLGFSHVNDQLQTYLSVIYIVSLFGDAVRLASLNLLQQFAPMRVLSLTAVVAGAYSASAAVFAHYFLVPISLDMATAVLAGYLNLLLVFLTIVRLRQGFYLSTQAISVAANFVTIPGFILLLVYSPNTIVSGMVRVFLILPLIQILALAALGRFAAPEACPSPSRGWRNLTLYGLHGLPVAGAQGFQIIVRGALLHSAEGYLSVFSLATRVFDSLRLAFVDTYVGRQLSKWKPGQNRLTDDVPFMNGRKFALHFLLAGVVLLCALAHPRNHTALLAQFALIMVPGIAYFSLSRILYVELNATASPLLGILLVGVFEIGFLALLSWICLVELGSVAVYIWGWFLLRNLLSILVVSRIRFAAFNALRNEKQSQAPAFVG